MSLRRIATPVLLLLILAPFVQAQSGIMGVERALQLSVTPEYPAPGEEIALSIASYGLDLPRSTVTWYVNGAVAAAGTGLTTARLTAGALGTATRVAVTAQDAEGLVATADAVIRPTELDLIWSADSYAPPFYRGRVMAGDNATIRVQALARFKRADGSFIPDTDIVYTWYKGSVRIAAGRGLSATAFPGPQLFATDHISVVAQSADGAYIGRAEAVISGVDPSVQLYENHPLFGVLYHRAIIGSASTGEDEEKVTAVPYFAHIQSPSDADLAYAWSLNGTALAPDPQHPETLTILTEGYDGPANIELTLTSAADWLLHASGAWELVFGASSDSIFSNNPFGMPAQ